MLLAQGTALEIKRLVRYGPVIKQSSVDRGDMKPHKYSIGREETW